MRHPMTSGRRYSGTRLLASAPRQSEKGVAVALPGPAHSPETGEDSRLCPEPPGFSFAIVGAMLT
jgi:hypothetical protein